VLRVSVACNLQLYEYSLCITYSVDVATGKQRMHVVESGRPLNPGYIFSATVYPGQCARICEPRNDPEIQVRFGRKTAEEIT
jgi:hypothetical protein